MRYFEDHPVLAQDVLEMLPNGIALLMMIRAVIGDLNQRLADMTGYELKELIGQGIEMIVPGCKGNRSCSRAVNTPQN